MRDLMDNKGIKELLGCVFVGACIGAIVGSAYMVFKFFVWMAS